MAADEDVLNAGNGGTPDGAFPYALAAMLYNANLFGLDKDYAFPEGSNTSASRWDQITSLAKMALRKFEMPDGNSYDLFDAVMTVCKWVLTQDPHLNDDEVNSVGYVKSSDA